MKNHPLQLYLKTIREDCQSGEYKAFLTHLTEALSISKPTLYRLTYPEGSQRRTLTPVKAIQLEIFTGGAVPADSVNKEMGDLLHMAQRLTAFRDNLRGPEPVT